MLHGQVHVIHSHNVSYFLELAYNLMSLSRAWEKGIKVIICDEKNERRERRMELNHNPSEIVKFIGNRTKDGL